MKGECGAMSTLSRTSLLATPVTFQIQDQDSADDDDVEGTTDHKNQEKVAQ
jgi:hypothetical protein